jgi:membrane-associated phospholipid phosphatase
MSVSGGFKPTTAKRTLARLQWLRGNVVQYFALFRRRPRSTVTPAWRAPRYLGIGAAVAIGVVVAAMLITDASAVGWVKRLPEPLVVAFDRMTDFGKSVYFLVPIALLLVAMAVLASPTLTMMSRRVLAAIAVRLGFLFVAIALPGLVFTIVKRLIGRARPLVEGSADPFLYRPLGWSVEYASLPSGHATDAFAIATAIGALWPRTRPIMWTYALLIAVSRVVLTAHFPSDVIAGAVVGTAGALIVRDWFAARRLAFTLAPDGAVRPMPGPSFARIKRVARQLIAP